MATLHFHGHATFTVVTDDGTRLVIDPWFTGNPVADQAREDVQADYILCTHGHADHFGDAIPLAKETGATLVSSFEIVAFAQTKGVENAHPMHIGGGYHFPFGYLKMTPALHGGSVEGDTEGTFTTVPGGFVLNPGAHGIYFAGDTALLMDMQLLRGQVSVAVLPIGDNFTMGPDDAVRAVEFIEPQVVVPFHYNTFDLIKQDPEAFKAKVGGRARVEILGSGDSLDL